MPNLYSTLMIAFVFIVLTIAGLAIGWLITGKPKVTPAADDLSKNSILKSDESTLSNAAPPTTEENSTALKQDSLPASSDRTS